MAAVQAPYRCNIAARAETPQRTRRERLTAWGSLGVAGLAFLVVFLLALPVAFFGIGLAMGIAYLGNPMFEGLLGDILQIGGTILAAVIAGLVAAEAASRR